MFSTAKPAQPTLPAEEAAGPPQRGAAPGPAPHRTPRPRREGCAQRPGPSARPRSSGRAGPTRGLERQPARPQQPQLPREDDDRSGKDGSRLIHVQVNLIASVCTL